MIDQIRFLKSFGKKILEKVLWISTADENFCRSVADNKKQFIKSSNRSPFSAKTFKRSWQSRSTWWSALAPSAANSSKTWPWLASAPPRKARSLWLTWTTSSGPTSTVSSSSRLRTSSSWRPPSLPRWAPCGSIGSPNNVVTFPLETSLCFHLASWMRILVLNSNGKALRLV